MPVRACEGGVGACTCMGGAVTVGCKAITHLGSFSPLLSLTCGHVDAGATNAIARVEITRPWRDQAPRQQHPRTHWHRHDHESHISIDFVKERPPQARTRRFLRRSQKVPLTLACATLEESGRKLFFTFDDDFRGCFGITAGA